MNCTEIWKFIERNILTITAIFISIISLVYTHLSLKTQRNHNIKSLKPIGKLRSIDYENNISLRIDNYGTGPLIIKSFFINNEDIGEKKGVIDFIPEEFANSLVWKNYTGSYPNRAITPNSNLELLAWSPSNYNDSEKEKIETDKNKLRKILKDLTLRIEYQGVYEDQTYSDELELSWYGRNLKEEETKPNTV